jgi:hypothetical protein
MRAQNIPNIFFLAVAGFLALAEANAFRRGIPDYGTPGSPGWEEPVNPPEAFDSLPTAGLDSLAPDTALTAPALEADVPALADSQALRTARRTRIARNSLGVVAVGGGTLLAYQGGRYLYSAAMVNIFLSILGSEERAPAEPGAVLLFGGLGAVGLGTYWFLVPWEAEGLPIRRVGLSLHPSGRGAAIAVSF